MVPRVSATAYGMTELNGLKGTIIDLSDSSIPASDVNTFTVDIDSSGFTAFSFPLTGNYPFTPAQVIPVGEDTAAALAFNQNVLSDSIVNTAYLGMVLKGGAGLPGGADNDVVYWVAGKSSNVDNEPVTNP